MSSSDSAALRATPSAPAEAAPLGPWNPGIRSFIPRHLLPLATIFRPENVSTSVDRAIELRDLTGLELAELVAFRPERLALHEVLIRVTADFSVSDGSRYADLGINFRATTGVLLADYVEPRMSEVRTAYDAARRRLAETISAELADDLGDGAEPDTARSPWPSRLLGLLRVGSPKVAAVASAQRIEDRAEAWAKRAEDAAADPARRAACAALARVERAIFASRGYRWGPPELIGAIATDLACNVYCSDEIGRLIEPWLQEAAAREGYRLLPNQAHPVVMNTKGPSASGKSTLRPLQKTLAMGIGVDWQDFALVSPDIWRKQLLDYSSLGADYRYGGMLTSEELAIVDHKLDRYMARKAEQGRMSHLLIDRFRFGSFAPHSDKAATKLLSRFGHAIYFFFMITPPEAIVERAWRRGLEFGRFKAVDDLLAHGVEAYSGMPQLFLTWAEQSAKPVHYEFLDNSVQRDRRPRTVAFGWNSEMVVLDVGRLLDISRYRKIDVEATAPARLFDGVASEALAPEGNLDFVTQCVRRLRHVSFADQAAGRVYLRMSAGHPAWVDVEAARAAMADPQVRACIDAIAPHVLEGACPMSAAPIYVRDLLADGRLATLGDWGEAAMPTEAPSAAAAGN